MKKEFFLGCVVSLAAIGVVGYAVKETKSPWALLGLLLVPTVRTTNREYASGNGENKPENE